MMRYVYSFICIAFLSVGLFSCQKSGDETPTEGSHVEYIDLVIDAKYVETEEFSLNKSATAEKNIEDEKPARSSRINGEFFSDYYLTEQGGKSSSTVKENLNSFSNINKIAAIREGGNYTGDTKNVKQIENGVKFMALIFDEDDDHVSTTIGTVGDATRIPVIIKKNSVPTHMKEFRIVAFTYNTSDARDFDNLNLTPSETKNNPNIILPSDRDFYYFNNTLSVSEKLSKVNMIFKPQTVKVGITLDGRGANVLVKKVRGSFGAFNFTNSAKFDLRLNKVLNREVISQSNYPYNFSVQNNNLDTLSVARFVYLDANDATVVLNNLSVTFDELVVQKKGNNANPETNILSSNATKSYSFGAINLTKGKYFNGRINLFSGFQVGDVIWSFTNLYYDKDAPNGEKYKFRNSPSDGYKTKSDYWAYYKEFPLSEDSNGDDIDPCSKVQPGGWSLPTKSQAQMINLDESDIFKSYYFYDATGSADERNFDYLELENAIGQRMRFYAFGMRDGLVYSGEGVDALYWTSDRGAAGQADILRVTITSTGNTTSNGSIKYPDYVITSVRGLNIRCVRELRN